jgi:hypothetical protein
MLRQPRIEDERVRASRLERGVEVPLTAGSASDRHAVGVKDVIPERYWPEP